VYIIIWGKGYLQCGRRKTSLSAAIFPRGKLHNTISCVHDASSNHLHRHITHKNTYPYCQATWKHNHSFCAAKSSALPFLALPPLPPQFSRRRVCFKRAPCLRHQTTSPNPAACFPFLESRLAAATVLLSMLFHNFKAASVRQIFFRKCDVAPYRLRPRAEGKERSYFSHETGARWTRSLVYVAVHMRIIYPVDL
jgi:hypothetical protein